MVDRLPMRHPKKLPKPTHIELHHEPWVRGTHVKTHVGPVFVEIFVDDREPGRRSAWLKALLELLEGVRDKARGLCANAVVSIEITLDPFASTEGEKRSGLRLSAQGTAVILESVA